MAELLKGKPVAQAMSAKIRDKCEELKLQGIVPTLAILRVGENDADLSYERGAVRTAEAAGITVKKVSLPADVDRSAFDDCLAELNADDGVHGILMMRPLPKHLDGEKARNMIRADKDVDGCTNASLTGVFTNTALGFAPCTAQAAVEILDHYGIEVKGKNVVIVGRSLVVGKPLAMLLLNRHATVTVCHTRTVDLPSITKKADIVISATGAMESLGAECFSPGQTVIDVGISWNDAKGKLCGDVRFDEAEPVVQAITPVPGGVGSVTTAVLMSHVAEAAGRKH